MIFLENKSLQSTALDEYLDVEPACREFMRKAPTVHLRGSDSSLGYAIVERLLRSRVNVIVPEDIHSTLLQQHSTELEYSECEFYSSNDIPLCPGHRLMLIGFGPFGDTYDEQSGFEVDELDITLVVPGGLVPEFDAHSMDSIVEVYDLLPRSYDRTWQNQTISTWMNTLQNGEQPCRVDDQQHWWVSDIDVADALVRILLSEQPFPARVKMSGRRAWDQEQSIEELVLLYQRTKAGQTGNFAIEHLTSSPSPNFEVKTLVVNPNLPMGIEDNSRQRPDLSPIHDVLHSIDGDGWRPLVPIRTALMHTLAGYLKE